MMTKVAGDLLTITQAAARLKVSRQNIRDAVTRGRLIFFKDR
jgi:excisionase family DNA binding protein